MAEVDDLELVDLDRPEEGDPGELLQEGFAISKVGERMRERRTG